MYPLKSILGYLSDLGRVRLGLEPKKALTTLFEVTLKCNLRCKYCYIAQETQRYPEGFSEQELSFSDCCKVLSQIKKSSRGLIFFGGEPFMRKDFAQLVDYAKTLGFDSIDSFTNGITLMENLEIIKKLDILYISYDSARKKQYGSIMDKVLKDAQFIKQNYNKRIMFDSTLTKDDTFEELKPFLDYVVRNKFTVFLQPLREDSGLLDFSWFNNFMRKVKKEYENNILYNKFIKEYSLTDTKLCVPKIMLFIDSKGNLAYPCQKFISCKIGNLLENDIDLLWEEGKKKYGKFPNEKCSHCGFICWWEISYNFKNPLRLFLTHLFK